LFGVVQQIVLIVVGKYHRSGYHRPRQAASPYFVETCFGEMWVKERLQHRARILVKWAIYVFLFRGYASSLFLLCV
jgi:hypothetical protein